jgi:glycosyl transferase family 87
MHKTISRFTVRFADFFESRLAEHAAGKSGRRLTLINLPLHPACLATCNPQNSNVDFFALKLIAVALQRGCAHLEPNPISPAKTAADLARLTNVSVAMTSQTQMTTSVAPHGRSRIIWSIVAYIAWTVVLLILIIRSAGGYHRPIAFVHFREAGLHWVQGEYLYGNRRGFIYSPLAAALFAPLAYMPPAVGIVLWQLTNAAALLGGLAAVLRMFPCHIRKDAGIACLLISPWAFGNLDIGHSNPLLVGLMMLGVAAAGSQRWGWVAICVALATYLKIYPVVVGMLLCVIAPRPFGWRFLVALLLLAIAPFFFQHWAYVADQYRAWIATRSADNRFNYPMKYAPLDLWFLIHWIGHLPFSPFLYTLVQVGSGGAVALFCAWAKWKRDWPAERLLAGIFCLASIWMTLLGPATESYTYILLAPTLILALVHVFRNAGAMWLKVCVLAAFAIQLAAIVRNMFLSSFKPLWIFSVQPLSALLFIAPCIVWITDDAYWRESVDPHPDRDGSGSIARRR